MFTPTLENNRLLARYMDYVIIDDNSNHPYLDVDPLKEVDSLPLLEYCFSTYAELMPIVEKIESDMSIAFNICQSTVNIAHNTDSSTEIFINIDILGTKEEAIYLGCVEFVKWYISKNSDLVALYK